MLGRISSQSAVCEPMPSNEVSRYKRNEKEDMKTAIEYLYEFKQKLEQLHPTAIDLIDNMLQRARY